MDDNCRRQGTVIRRGPDDPTSPMKFAVVSQSSRYRAECAGNTTPLRAPRCVIGQMDNDPACGTLKPRAELKQALAQGADLGSRTRRARGPKPQLLHQHIGGGREQCAHLVGPETRATGAIDRQTVQQLLDAVFNVRPLAVDRRVHPLRHPAKISHHKTGIVPRFAVTEAHHLGFEDHPPLAIPAVRGVTALPVPVFGLATLRRQPPYLLHQRLDQALEHGVLRHRHDILHALGFQKLKHLRTGEMRDGPHSLDSGTGLISGIFCGTL